MNGEDTVMEWVDNNLPDLEEKIEQETEDMVNPDHYKKLCSMECIDIMLIAFGRESIIDGCKMNAFKYLFRYKHKGSPQTDLEKALWYLNKASELSYEWLKECNINCVDIENGDDPQIKQMRDLANQYLEELQ